jgi:hypothetical protein
MYIISGHIRYFQHEGAGKESNGRRKQPWKSLSQGLEKMGAFQWSRALKMRALLSSPIGPGHKIRCGDNSWCHWKRQIGQTFIPGYDAVCKKALWSASKNSARSWSTNTALSGHLMHGFNLKSNRSGTKTHRNWLRNRG